MGKLGSYLKEKLSYFDLNGRAEKGAREKVGTPAHKKILEEISELGERAVTYGRAYKLAYNTLVSVYDTPAKESERLLELAKALAVVTINNGSEEEIGLRENELANYGRLLRESNAKEARK